MTTTTAVTDRLPWQDRWHEPTVEQLFEPLNPQHGKALRLLMDRIESYGQLERSLLWYGPGWNWTLRYDIRDFEDNDLETLCYLVPREESPQVCVPLGAATLEKLPLRRLHKYVRNGVRGSKCTVELYWATWNLTASSEAEQLVELIKRKHKIVLDPHKSPKKK
ncbi:MAG: hypothetical protein CMJ18_01655 [Phycisphaeraceae bacterium]|nr:hypothetical protein [Phycisphaeraceae bacterium]